MSKIQEIYLGGFRFRFRYPLVLLAQSFPDLHRVLVYRLDGMNLLVADGGNQDCRSTIPSFVPLVKKIAARSGVDVLANTTGGIGSVPLTSRQQSSTLSCAFIFEDHAR